MSDDRRRCDWCLGSEAMRHYHDTEWGVPEHDDRRLFEKLILDGAQAGLSWSTILDKREGYRRAFAGFDARVIARWGEAEVERLMAEPGIVRNRQKIRSAIGNARAFLRLGEDLGSFDAYLWGFVGGQPMVHSFRELSELPAQTELSVKLSKDLKGRGFSFVGPTIVYAYMQAVGLVNDHLVSCFRHREVQRSTPAGAA